MWTQKRFAQHGLKALLWKSGILGLGSSVLLGSSAWAQWTQRVSVGNDGVQGDGHSYQPSMSADGRFVAFWSFASNLVAGGTSGTYDVFVRDRERGTTEQVSVATSGATGNDQSYEASISADGRFVAFQSFSSNLVPEDVNGCSDVFVRDRQNGTTVRVSLHSSGEQGNDSSFGPSISADGRYVAFSGDATNLVVGDTNQTRDVFVHDLQSGTTERVSVDSSGVPGNGQSDSCTLSADGRYVVFRTAASNLVPGDTNGVADTLVHDRSSGTTELVSQSSAGMLGDGSSDFASSISPGGRYVVFSSRAANLVPGDTNMRMDVFLRDRELGTTERVSLDPSGGQGTEDSGIVRRAISDDGRLVTFASAGEIFLRDRQSGTTERVCVGGDLSISPDGHDLAFSSEAADLVPWDTNDRSDVFLRDPTGGPAFTSLCDPGREGVIACPCSNPPGGSGRGCNNSSGTGGATLTASGGTYLSSDSLAFTTNGEKPTAMSILIQGNGVDPGGVVYGQGIRCVGGTTIRRLFTKAAAGGSITAPDFDAGDPTVSMRSAGKGDVIQPGQSRWYLVYYRDPTVLGGCPGTRTFNATQTGQVGWSP